MRLGQSDNISLHSSIPSELSLYFGRNLLFRKFALLALLWLGLGVTLRELGSIELLNFELRTKKARNQNQLFILATMMEKLKQSHTQVRVEHYSEPFLSYRSSNPKT